MLDAEVLELGGADGVTPPDALEKRRKGAFGLGDLALLTGEAQFVAPSDDLGREFVAQEFKVFIVVPEERNSLGRRA